MDLKPDFNLEMYIPNYEISFLLYSCLSTPELFYSIARYNKKAVECINPKNKDLYPDKLLIYLDQISIMRDVLILNKPIPELKAVKESLEMWLGRYTKGYKTVSEETKKQMQEVTEHLKSEIEEANQYLAEAITLRR